MFTMGDRRLSLAILAFVLKGHFRKLSQSLLRRTKLVSRAALHAVTGGRGTWGSNFPDYTSQSRRVLWVF